MRPVQALARQHPYEELANSVTHGIGAILSIGALAAMVGSDSTSGR